MLTLPSPQILALLAIAVIYAAYDVFNKRNVPDVFVYASVLFGLGMTLVYSSGMLEFSLLAALVVFAVGYLIYLLGLWGAGDCFELVAISLMLPVQQTPLLTNTLQFGLPFVLSVFIATGFAAIWAVPLYYLVLKRARMEHRPDAKHVARSLELVALYIILFALMYALLGFSNSRLLLLLMLAIPSSLTVLYEEEVTARMIEEIYPRALEEGDMIAFNAMSRKEKSYFSKYKNFGRLATEKMISELRNVRKKLPVYRNAAPFAAFILIGVIISLLFGNVILLVV